MTNASGCRTVNITVNICKNVGFNIMRGKPNDRAYKDRSWFGFCGPNRRADPDRTHAPYDIPSQYDDDHPYEVDTEHDAESGPLMSCVMRLVAFAPCMSQHDEQGVREHQTEWKNEEEPDGCVDKCNVEWSLADVGSMIDKEHDVTVYQDHGKEAQEDG